MDKFINTVAKQINDYIACLKYNERVSNLYQPIIYTLDNGGKRVRPLMMLLAYKLFKEDYMSIINNALALEVYHNFTLLHDDVMDKAKMRRGKPCVHVKWDENTAILSGDAMLIYAYMLMTKDFNENKLDHSQILPFNKALDTFNQATLGVCEGQQFDMDFENMNDVTEQQYMNMIRLKTSLLLSAAMKMGAQLAEADDDDAQRLFDFGEKIGLAFQIQDDILDVYADPNVFGKAVGGDIAENKKTYLLIKTFEAADNQLIEQLNYWIGLKQFDFQEKFEAVKNIYDILNIRQIAENKVNELFNDAMNLLNDVNVPDDKKSYLRQFALKLMNRDN